MMTDDLERRLRDSLADVDLPSAPPTLLRVLDGPAHGKVGNRSVRKRAASSFTPALIGVIALLAVALISSSWVSQFGATTPPVTTPIASPSTPSDASSGELTANARELTLVATFDQLEVAPGGNVIVDVVIRNDRSEPVILALDQCGAPATMYSMVAVPTEPTGREWDGIAGVFKEYALTVGTGPGGALATAPKRIYATPTQCKNGASELSLSPGESTTTSLEWAAELVAGVPALPGLSAFSISVGHDPTGEQPSHPPDYEGPVGMFLRNFEQLTVEGVLDIAGSKPNIITAGEALDSILADDRFAAWLSERPESTWSTANLFVWNRVPAEGIRPAGPSWEIDLFREVDVPRDWAVGFVDPFDGKLRGVSYCDAPCER